MNRPRFAIAGVPSISKMYRTSAPCDILSVLHVVYKIRVYIVRFVKIIYNLIPEAASALDYEIVRVFIT